MKIKGIVNTWWRKSCLNPSYHRPKAALQSAIELELARLKQENTPLNTQMPFKEKQQRAHLSGSSLSGIFQR